MKTPDPRHFLDRLTRRHDPEVTPESPAGSPVPIDRRTSATKLLLVAGGMMLATPAIAGRGIVWDDPSTAVEVTLPGASSSSIMQAWYITDGTKACWVESTTGSLRGTVVCYDGVSTTAEVDFTGTDLEGEDVEGMKIADDGSTVYLTADMYNYVTDINDLAGSLVYLGFTSAHGFTPSDQSSTGYFESESPGTAHEIYEGASGTATGTPYLSASPDHLEWPDDCTSELLMSFTPYTSSLQDADIVSYDYTEGWAADPVTEGFAGNCVISADGTTAYLYFDKAPYSGAYPTIHLLQGTVSDTPTMTCYADADSDGFGDPATFEEDVESCSSGYVENSTDCDDTDPLINPDADEECDSVDNDCDGDTDEDSAVDALTWYQDNDGDNYGTTADTTLACSQPSGFAPTSDDCDDTDATRNPGETEVPYNGVDDDCNSATLDDDLDRDGYPLADDCDDSDAGRNPGEIEYCDGVDNNCSGDEDDAVDAELWYEDNDGDNYGIGDPVLACTAPTGYTAEDGDCDDDSSVTYPDAPELCDEVDNDCDEVVDNDVTYVDWYLDSDEDGFGDPATGLSSCEDLSWEGYVTNDDDCNDNDSYVNPDATEVYDGVDNNCDGNTDLTDPTCQVIGGDCDDQGATKAVSAVFALPMVEEECTIEFTVAMGTDGQPAELTLSPGTSLDLFFEGIDATGYYAVELAEGSHTMYDSHHTSTDILEGADGYLFGHSGSKRETTYGNAQLIMKTLAPTITLFEGDVWGEGREGLTQLTDYTCTEVGDKLVINTEEGTIEMNPEDNPDDTGETDDTGITTPPDGCPGCSSLDGSRAGYGLAMLGLAGLATATGRRKRYQPELDGYNN